ncbi:hypothetical protein Tco_0013978 [Tanacetum coccineum]
MIEEEETQASKKIKEQILQEEAGLTKAIRLDALEKEEVAKQAHLDSLIAQRMAEEQELTEQQKKRKAQVQFEAQSYTEEDWDTIRAKLEANAELKDMKAEFEILVKQLDTFVPINFEATKESLKRFGEELQTKTAKKLKFDDEGTQLIEKIEEDKDDKSINKTGKRRKHIARKGLHKDHDKDESKDSDKASEKDNSTSGTKIPINHVPVDTKSTSIANYKIIKQGRKGVYQIVRENGTDMKLQRGKPDEDCYKLLKMMEKQAGAKGLTSPEQTATVEMVFSQPWTCTFLVSKGMTTPELMANW